MVVRCLSCWSIENIGAIFTCNDVLGFYPCSARVAEGTVFIFAPLMPSPCEGVRLPRSTRRLSEVSNSGRAGALSLQPHVEVWPVERHRAQRSGSRTWAPSHCRGRGEVEALQFDRGGSDAMLREQRVRDQDVCSLSGRLVSMCHHTWSFVAATDQTRSSSLSTKSTT